MPHDPYRALYVHIPFCVRRCAYCDFDASAVPADSPEIDAYFEGLVERIRRASKEGELAAIETVYLGGGTPTHAGLSRISSLLYALSLSMNLTTDVECTMEANPESLTDRIVKDAYALGVNRLSLGVQSFDDSVLRTLGRAHDACTALNAIQIARERFENVSVDIMCGIPGQTDESLAETVEQAIEAGVTHVSVYPLTIEPFTPFYAMVKKGALPEPDDDVEARHMECARDILRAHGFSRYEVASYARPGYECKHNIAYWTGVPYLGIGRSAATMTQNDQRRMRVQNGEVTDDLNPAQMLAEDLMLGMRMSRGVSVDAVERALSLLPQARAVFEDLAERGLVYLDEGRFKPTETGWLCGNELYGDIFDLA